MEISTSHETDIMPKWNVITLSIILYLISFIGDFARLLRGYVDENSTEQRSVLKSFHTIFHRHQPALLPDHFSWLIFLLLSALFSPKNSAIFHLLQTSGHLKADHYVWVRLSSFTIASVEEICKVIIASPYKPCDLNSISTSLLKDLIDVLRTPITSLVKVSPSQVIFFST